MKILFVLFILTGFISSHANAACFLVEGSKKTPFDGKSLSGIAVEKKSLIVVNREFPSLYVIEGTFKGEVQTCSNCTEKYISCSE